MECFWGRGINAVGECTESSRGYQWNQVKGMNGCIVTGFAIGRFFFVIGAHYGDHPLAVFVGLGQVEAIIHQIEILLHSSQLLQIVKR